MVISCIHTETSVQVLNGRNVIYLKTERVLKTEWKDVYEQGKKILCWLIIKIEIGSANQYLGCFGPFLSTSREKIAKNNKN